MKPDRHKRRRRWFKRAAIGAGLLVAMVAFDYFAYPYGAFDSGRSANHGENGLWLRYTWYFGDHSDADTRQLCRDLTNRQIRYAYFHVRSIDKDGRLKYRIADKAKNLTSAIHKLAPAVRPIAWIYAGNHAGLGEVDLTNASIRKTMVEEAVWLVDKCGFDGVQWDYEICPDGDAGFLSLLEETRAALPRKSILSAAVPMWLPWPLGRWGWSDEYLKSVAAQCDQIAVMCYDSGFWLPRSYAWLVREQAFHATQSAAAANPNCRVLLGLPTYGPAGLSHNLRAENLLVALKGVRDAAVDSALDKNTFAGVALFADYTTDSSEWAEYEQLWLGRPSH